ncbi:hypothetical protein ACHAC9_23720 [Massilia sp. CMS3.1]
MARQGMGLAFVSHPEARALITAGELEPALESFIPADNGLYL